MNITSELEKLAALKESGDLTEAEYGKAKAILLSMESEEVPNFKDSGSGTLADKRKSRKLRLLVAVCATIAALMSAVSAVIDPSAIALAILVLWMVSSILGWYSYARIKAEIEQLEDETSKKSGLK